MPNNVIKSFSEKTGLSTKEIEEIWSKAKAYVTNELNIKESEGDKYWKAVTGTLKHWLKGKLKKEEFEQFFKLLEDTATGDVVKYDQPLGVVTRRPDGSTHEGHPFFNIDDKHTISKILDGKKKSERWEHLLQDKGIHHWANKNFLKSFYIKTPEGLFIKVR
jgi:Zn-dependent M16 (insulinase) family peptidase